MKKTTSGFTIVELLIVIVVIAILATITVVAYNGIQRRARDSRIQQQLIEARKVLELERTTTGKWPFEDEARARIAVNDEGGATTAVRNWFQARGVQSGSTGNNCSGSYTSASIDSDNTLRWAFGVTMPDSECTSSTNDAFYVGWKSIRVVRNNQRSLVE